MRFSVLYESENRLRIHVLQDRMSFEQADILLYYIKQQDGVDYARVSERTCDAVIKFSAPKEEIIKALGRFNYNKANVPKDFIKNSGRAIRVEYEEKLILKIAGRILKKLYLPAPISIALTLITAVKYIKKGLDSILKTKLTVEVLDSIAIGVSLIQRNFDTASSVMFLLGIGELLEEWTHKKTVDDLARTMSLNVNKVWLIKDGLEVLVDFGEVNTGDRVIVRVGNVIPFDGTVVSGEAMVNQATMTGESEPVRKAEGNSVFAGTVLEEGEITLIVKQCDGKSRFEKIVAMIEETEKLKSEVESKAERIADGLVPYTLLGTGLTYFLTRNVTKAVSVLMVDFSCAIKLATPISVLSAIKEAGLCGITVKGGKYLEAVAEADTIVFDKTGTLTKAEPKVMRVVPFTERSEDELLRIAACLEEHFPHSIANAVVNAAKEKGLNHEEMHSKVNYIVAHGISTTITATGEKAIIGSYHFVFEDEKTVISDEFKKSFEELPDDMSKLYMAIGGTLAAVICISDPIRKEAPEVIRKLKDAGIKNIVMMTGDNENTARAIAKEVGIDKYYASVMPEDKARFVEEEKAKGRKVVMVGDGINDSPALSAANCAVAISKGAEIAKEVADITLLAEDLNELVKLREISTALMDRIHKNYRKIVAVNGSLIALGVLGLLAPETSALFHNASTLLIGIGSMTDLT